MLIMTKGIPTFPAAKYAPLEDATATANWLAAQDDTSLDAEAIDELDVTVSPRTLNTITVAAIARPNTRSLVCDAIMAGTFDFFGFSHSNYPSQCLYLDRRGVAALRWADVNILRLAHQALE